MLNNHGRIGKTIAEGVKLNLGGGAEVEVDLHLNEEGFLLIDNLGLTQFDYEWRWHTLDDGSKRVELQILYRDEDEDLENWDE
ncbi:hypothetical protein A616_16790 [Brevibacillus brevis X23]|nr:hypothetical protein A616_16790 [Brevibacillus brevis X23]